MKKTLNKVKIVKLKKKKYKNDFLKIFLKINI